MKKRILKILSIDDNYDWQRVAAKFFTLVGGHKVYTAENGSEGLKKAARLRPDIILLDMCMPGTNGLEVINALCADTVTGDIPVVMLTGSGVSDADYKELKASRNFLFLEEKPASLNQLLGKIEDTLNTTALEPGGATDGFERLNETA